MSNRSRLGTGAHCLISIFLINPTISYRELHKPKRGGGSDEGKKKKKINIYKVE